MTMTTVGDLRWRLSEYPDDAPLEFWLLNSDRPIRIAQLNADSFVRQATAGPVEIIFKGTDK